MYKRILVPIDGSTASMTGLQEATRLAKSSGGKLRILHVVDGIAFVDFHGAFMPDLDKFRESGNKLVKDVMARVRKQNVRADSVVVENMTGRAADTIVKEAKKFDAQVIVMGTHGRRGLNRLVLGSDAEIVLREAPVPVLLVRSGKRGTRKKSRMR